MMRKNWVAIVCTAIALFLSSAVVVRAAVRVSGAFGDHMVLQRDAQVPIWGWAQPGEKIGVSFAGQNVSTQADKEGQWTAALAAMPASAQSRTLTVSAANTIELKDILVGEVWICSGQSNMELTARQGLVNPDVEIAAANYPQIRLNLIEKIVADKPLRDLKGNWTTCTPESMRSFSAAAYFFGREVHQKLSVPVGLIGAYYGGSNGQSWLRREAFQADPLLAPYLTQWEARMQSGRGAATSPATQPAGSSTGGVKPNSGNGPASRYRPSNFYNGMLSPLIPFSMRGVLWYQGEANTANAKDAGLYAPLFSTMIRDWRAQWGRDFPFIFVQLPTSEPDYPNPTDSAWARVRESQQKALAVPNTAMIVTLDIGEGAVVHAHNKKEVGLRLAATALNKVYGKNEIACEGPMFSKMEIAADRAILSFQNVGDGLLCKNPAGLKGFAIAGADQNFVWADARIEGDKVIVSSPQVKTPIAVRYAWADNPQVSLFGKSGLPVAPFRTDDWPATKISNPRASP